MKEEQLLLFFICFKENLFNDARKVNDSEGTHGKI
jgi:hypothetical protein